VAASLNNLAKLHESQGRYDESELLYVRSLKIMEVRLGIAHPKTMMVRSNLAALYRKMSSPFSLVQQPSLHGLLSQSPLSRLDFESSSIQSPVRDVEL
jgi:Tetratricopeptide repeat